MTLTLTLLGGFEARLSAGKAVNLPTTKAQALLAYLALQPGTAHQRSKLASLLWGNTSEVRARDGLRHVLVALRKALRDVTPPALLAEGQTLVLNSAVVDVDVATFQRRIAQGTPRALEQAAALYRGDLLLGFSVSEPLFEEWLIAERERLREMALEGLARLLAHQSNSGRTERAIQTAIRILGLDPLQEAVHRALMRMYAQQGRRAAALKQYQTCLAVLRGELGAEPEAETKRLYHELLRRSTEALRSTGLRGADSDRATHTAAAPRLPFPSPETPLFGRDAELERLQELLGQTICGHGQLAIVIGEAGIGKTRLLSAIATDALQRGCSILIGRCHESDSILPFGPWVDACRRAELTVNDEILGALRPPWRAELTRLFPEANRGGLSPSGNSDLRLFEAVAELVELLATRQPLVVMLEDLHWADEMSLRLLAFVARRMREWRALFIATVREEELADAPAARRTVRELGRESVATPLELRALAQPDTALLVRALARTETDAKTVACLENHVWAMSEGNPFVAVETTRALQEGGLLSDSMTLPLPQGVRELIARRLERLSDRARALAAVAAMIGREFEFRLLQLAGGLDEHQTAEGVDELVRRHVLRGIGERFDFSHHRVRAVIHDGLLLAQRRVRHRLVGEALETLYASNLEPYYLALGRHFLEGEVGAKAVKFLRQAGRQAYTRSAHKAAVACLEQSLEALAGLPETDDTLGLAIDLRLDLRHSLVYRGQFTRVLHYLRDAEALAMRLGDQRRLGFISCYLSNCLRHLGQSQLAIEIGERALAIATAVGDLTLDVTVYHHVAEIYTYVGNYRRARALLTRAVTLLKDSLAQERSGPLAAYRSPGDTTGGDDFGPTLLLTTSRFWLCLCLAELGEYEEAMRCAKEGVRDAENFQPPNSQLLMVAYLALGNLHLHQGDVDTAICLIERALTECRRGDYVANLPSLTSRLGQAYALSGRCSEARALFEEAEQQAALTAFQSWRARRLAHVGEAHLMAGRCEEALAAASGAVNVARAQDERGHEAWALRLMGQIASHGDPPKLDQAERYYREAWTIASELEMRPLVAHCHLGLAEVARHVGDPLQCQQYLSTAAAMYREMNMAQWLEKAEAEMRVSR